MNSSRPFGVRSVHEEYSTAAEDAGRFGRPARARGRASSSLVHRGRLDPPFFQAKLRTPSRPRHFVRRRRLLSLLDDLSEYPITAIVAPAGAGKTVLAADWLADRPGPSAWLTVDAADQDVIEFWRSLVIALDGLVPGIATEFSGQPPPTEEDPSILTRMPAADSAGPPAMLVIDNVDRIDGGAAGALLASVVEQRPAWLHLLLLSRRRPPLPVDRLRGRGDLADIHFGALRFSDAEACALLGRLCPDLPAADLRAAARRANGWAAALQLTALAIRSQPFAAQPSSVPSRYPGTEKLVDEYLWREVLQPERPDLVRLLLSTAVVGRLNYGLAEALSQRPDAGDLLEEAEAAGLFVTALEGGWFEVHNLVRDMLMTRLERRWPEGLRELHARAAQWFEGTDDPVVALDHWLRAERPADALRLLAELSLPLLATGRSGRVVDALERIPAELATADIDDAVRYAWCQLAVGQGAFLTGLSLAEAAAARGAAGDRIETLRAVSASLVGDWRTAAATARHATAGLPATRDGDALDRFGWHLVSSGIALDERWDDRVPAVREARAACLRNPAGRWAFEASRAVGLVLAGRPAEALRVTDGAKHAAGSGRFDTVRIELALAEGMVARELDQRDAARITLEELAATPSYPNPILQLLAQLEVVRLQLSTGDLTNAATGLDEAEAHAARLVSPVPGTTGRHPAPPAGAPGNLVARVGVDLALAGDDPATAVRWAAQVSDPFWRPVCEAKINLARGRTEPAAHVLPRAMPRCPRHQVIAGLLRGQVMVASDRTTAEDAVATALDLAISHAMLRTVASDGAAVMELIERAAWRAPEPWMNRLRHAIAPVWSSPAAQRPVDDLTDRERDVLRLLPSRLTLSEIASELYVSPNTLKFHLRGIYRKLGAESRGQAVDSARQMRLLPRG